MQLEQSLASQVSLHNPSNVSSQSNHTIFFYLIKDVFSFESQIGSSFKTFLFGFGLV